ncbi:MAG TPA: hypothetical protein PK961_09120 [bacterium]|nr:hypothetical protein [bacterium]
MTIRRSGLLLFLLAMVFLATGFTTCQQTAGPDEALTAPPVAATPAPPPAPKLTLLKVSGAGFKNRFRARLQWNGDQPTKWTVKRWSMMVDRTDQTQSMLVLADQSFTVAPGEPRDIFVEAMCVNPDKPAPRHLIVEYEGAPKYELTQTIDQPIVRSIVNAVAEVEDGMQAVLPKLTFRGDRYEYSPRALSARDRQYLELVLWEIDGDKPLPYLEEDMIRSAIIVGVSGGMSVESYLAYLQQMGLTKDEARTDHKRLVARVNLLLEMAGLEGRLATR